MSFLEKSRLSKRAITLFELQSGLDAIQDSEKKQKRFDALPKGMQDQLDALWGQLYSDRGRKNIPTSGGRWSGEAGDSIWIPDDQIVPPDKGYSNMQQKTWGQIKRENGISGIRFSDGRVDFSPVTKYAVKFDWEKELGGDGIRYLVQTGDRQYLHEAAFSKLAAKLGKSIEEVKQLKESLACKN